MSTNFERIAKLDALAKDPGATEGERSNAKVLAAKLRAKEPEPQISPANDEYMEQVRRTAAAMNQMFNQQHQARQQYNEWRAQMMQQASRYSQHRYDPWVDPLPDYVMFSITALVVAIFIVILRIT